MSVVIKGDSNVNLDFSTGGRITGDFSNATLANRVMFQSTTAGGGTSVAAIPNATGDNSAFNVFANPDPTNTSFGQFRVGAGTGDVRLTSGISGTGTYLPMTFYTGGSERVRIDTSGNVGIGTSSPATKVHALTPSATSVAFRAGNSVSYAELQVDASGNSQLIAPGGTQIFNTNGAERMRITSSGDVGIGTSSPSYTLHVAKAGADASIFLESISSGAAIYRARASSQALAAYNGFQSLYGTGSTASWSISGNGAVDTIAFNTGTTERARIDSSGRLGLGVTPSAWGTTNSGALQVKNISLAAFDTNDLLLTSNAYFDGASWRYISSSVAATNYVQTLGTHYWRYAAAGTAGNAFSWSEAMRIDSSGNLLVGTATAGARTVIARPDNDVVFRVYNALTSGTTIDLSQVITAQTAGTGYNLLRLFTSNGGAAQFAVRGDGTVYAQNTTIQSISDVRTKENVRDADDGLQTILGLRPVRFDFKEGFGNNRKNQLGFIAQEMEQVFPDAVDVAGEKDENGDPYKSVGPSALIPVLVKAIQEQQAIIESLTARITALEAK